MKKIEITVYEFSELHEKIQDKLVNEYTLYDDGYEYMIEEWHKKLSLMGYKNPKIKFSGFGSQGDGASFTCTLDPKTFGVEPGVYISRRNSKYLHEKSCFIDGYFDDPDRRKELLEQYRNICKKIYRGLEEEHDYLTSKEAIKEHYTANECMFYEDGRIYHETR